MAQTFLSARPSFSGRAALQGRVPSQIDDGLHALPWPEAIASPIVIPTSEATRICSYPSLSSWAPWVPNH